MIPSSVAILGYQIRNGAERRFGDESQEYAVMRADLPQPPREGEEGKGGRNPTGKNVAYVVRRDAESVRAPRAGAVAMRLGGSEGGESKPEAMAVAAIMTAAPVAVEEEYLPAVARWLEEEAAAEATRVAAAPLPAAAVGAASGTGQLSATIKGFYPFPGDPLRHGLLGWLFRDVHQAVAVRCGGDRLLVDFMTAVRTLVSIPRPLGHM